MVSDNESSRLQAGVKETSPLSHKTDVNYRVFVGSEFAPLHTVVLTQSEFGGGLFDGDVSSADNRKISPPPVDQIRFEAEREAFGQLLAKYNVEILRPRLFTAAEKEAGRKTGYANFFVRDPWFTFTIKAKSAFSFALSGDCA